VAWHARARIPVSSQDNPLLQWVKIYGAKRVHKDAKSKKVRVVGARGEQPRMQNLHLSISASQTPHAGFITLERGEERGACTYVLSSSLAEAGLFSLRARSEAKRSFRLLL
jgi:hypothetical protein